MTGKTIHEGENRDVSRFIKALWKTPKTHTGGLEIDLTKEELWDVLSCSKVAESVRVRLFDPRKHKNCSIRCASFEALERVISEKSNAGSSSYRADLELFLPLKKRHRARLDKGGGLMIQTTTTSSSLYHSGAITERIERFLWWMRLLGPTDHLHTPIDALQAFVASKTKRPSSSSSSMDLGRDGRHGPGRAERDRGDDNKGDEHGERRDEEAAEEREWNTRLYARLVENELELSISATGERLHKRGLRENVVPGSIRETLAAACLQVAGYDPNKDVLWDPFCGSGTFLLEAITAHDPSGPTASNLLDPERFFSCELWAWHPDQTFVRYRQTKRNILTKLLSSRLRLSPLPLSFPSAPAPASNAISHQDARHGQQRKDGDEVLFVGSDIATKAIETTRANIRSLFKHLQPSSKEQQQQQHQPPQHTGLSLLSCFSFSLSPLPLHIPCGLFGRDWQRTAFDDRPAATPKGPEDWPVKAVRVRRGDFETVGNELLARDGVLGAQTPLIVTNLPYGKQQEGDSFHVARWTRFVAANFGRFRGVFALFPSDPVSVSALHGACRSLPFCWQPVASFTNGGIPVHLNRFVPSSSSSSSAKPRSSSRTPGPRAAIASKKPLSSTAR